MQLMLAIFHGLFDYVGRMNLTHAPKSVYEQITLGWLFVRLQPKNITIRNTSSYTYRRARSRAYIFKLFSQRIIICAERF